MQSPGCKHLQVPQKEKQDAIIRLQASSSVIERKTRCNHQAASILKCHRKKSKIQSPGCKHPQVPQKEKQDAITGQQASSSAIERKNKMQSPGSEHPQVPQKEKARCNHQAASILKCHRKKNKMQSPGSKHLQVPQKEKQDVITRQQASSSAIERKTRCNHQTASILKCPKKKNKIQLLIRDHLQNMENTS